MKKSLFLLLPLLLLSSCSGNTDSKDVLSRSKAFVSTLKETDKNHYTVEVTGHVLQFDQIDEPRERGYSLPTGSTQESDYGQSYLLRAPLRITKENFYPEDGSELSPSVFTYGYIREKLTWQYDSRTSLCFTSDEETMTFYVVGLSKSITFYNIVTMDDDPFTPEENDPYSSSVTLYARYDISLTYDKEGLLIEEKATTQNPMSDDPSRTVEVTGTYTYSAQ